jgi:hypothetical protein
MLKDKKVSKKRYEIPKDKLEKMYNDGVSYLDMANYFNCTRFTIRCRIKEYNFTKRKKPRNISTKLDLIGKQFGKLKVLSRIDGKKDVKWLCECDCGNTRNVIQISLISGVIDRCVKCLSDSKKVLGYEDMTNKKFGNLKILSFYGRNNSGNILWKARCECGKISYPTSGNLRSRQSTSCGKCFEYREITSDFWKRFLSSAKDRNIEVFIKIEDLYDIYIKQKRRCSLTNQEVIISSYSNETTASIDRIDSSKGYTKENTQIVLKKINVMKNKYKEQEFIELCKLVAKGPKS